MDTKRRTFVLRPDNLICDECGNEDSEQWRSRGHNWECKKCGHTFTKSKVDNPTGGEKSVSNGKTEFRSFDTPQEIHDEKQLIKAANIDTEVWKIIRWTCGVSPAYRKDRKVKWKVRDGKVVTGDVDDSGELLTKQLWAVKVWLERRTQYIEDKSALLKLIRDAKKYAPKYPKVKYPKLKNDCMLEVDVFDLHFGKLTWEPESGQDYDIKLAASMAKKALAELLSHGSRYEISKILMPIGNDFFNVDNLQEETTHGTPQQEDTRWTKTFTRGRELAVELIEMCASIAPVDVISVRGNHAEQREFYLGDSLYSWFHSSKDVQVDNAPKLRKYYQFDKCLIGFTHGYHEKLTQLPSLMPIEAPIMYSQTTHREWHLGDKHHMEAMRQSFPYAVDAHEGDGVTVRILRSLSATDLWTYNKGFVGARRAAEAFLWHPQDGMIATFNALGE